MNVKMGNRLLSVLLLGGLASSILSGCAGTPVTLVTIDNFEWRSAKLTADKAVPLVTNAFVERGFDIKVLSKETGVVTTEYKKFASVGDAPPFDFYMQLKGSIRTDAKGSQKLLVRLTPIVKAVNRINAGAFTEQNLAYITVDDPGISASDIDMRMRPQAGWMAIGQTLFMNVASDLSDLFGIPIEEITQNTTKTPGTAGAITW
jgi:hypothetical protein